jgi:hypothetical protein
MRTYVISSNILILYTTWITEEWLLTWEKNYFLLRSVQTLFGVYQSCSMGHWGFMTGVSCRSIKLAIYVHIMPRLRLGGAIFLFPHMSPMACVETNFTNPLRCGVVSRHLVESPYFGRQRHLCYIGSCPPYLNAFSSVRNLRTLHAVVSKNSPHSSPLMLVVLLNCYYYY